jgi:hypothetical protein
MAESFGVGTSVVRFDAARAVHGVSELCRGSATRALQAGPAPELGIWRARGLDTPRDGASQARRANPRPEL